MMCTIHGASSPRCEQPLKKRLKRAGEPPLYCEQLAEPIAVLRPNRGVELKPTPQVAASRWQGTCSGLRQAVTANLREQGRS